MSRLDFEAFDDYFTALHGQEPYPWQRRLARRAIEGDWPGAIDLPTGSGKTACIDIAIFALACQSDRPPCERVAARRIFFCVNRRVIVDEAHLRSKHIAERIGVAEASSAAGASVLRDVAAALRKLAGTIQGDHAPPLDVLELRGGIYRDNRWARSATQPAVVCTTIDQLGSRLLFRGYGVSSGAAPIQAALIAYDSLILLDEAHISEPFRQTLDHVQRYLDPEKWAAQAIGVRPVRVVPMTATPPPNVDAGNVVRLLENDREHESLRRRLQAEKPAELREVKKNLASAAVQAATHLVRDKPAAVGIIVNRVATAKAIYELLRSEPIRRKHPEALVELVIGSMRPIDRDEQASRLRAVVGPARPEVTEDTSFVVATQCLEVGADYDFDALVTECASLDALRQRFGRLNRAGRPVDAEAVVVAAKGDIKAEDKLDNDKPLDPIYGNALARTWNWLMEHARDNRIAFGIDAFNVLIEQDGEGGRIPGKLLAPSALLDAPVLLPAYLDLWCQTSPRPLPDPDVALFLHGPQRGEPDVQVCWRADLGEGGDDPEPDAWCDVVALLPPTSAECMSVPISRLRRWLTARDADSSADHGDLLGAAVEDEQEDGTQRKASAQDADLRHRGVLWRGARESVLLRSPADLRPGDTLVFPAAAGGWDDLGHLPCIAPEDSAVAELASIDRAEEAFRGARDRLALRIHPSLRALWPGGRAIDRLFERLDDSDGRATQAELDDIFRSAAEALAEKGDATRAAALQALTASARPLRDLYPDGRGVVLRSRSRIGRGGPGALAVLDDGDDALCRTLRTAPVTLADHTRHVEEALDHSLARLLVETPRDAFRGAAGLHDLGKADERFQAMLRRTDRTDAWLVAGVSASLLLAKDDGSPRSPRQRREARTRAGLPEGFRHEMLSVRIAEHSDRLPDDAMSRKLALHLIAAHHGRARPFAPVVVDDDPPDVEVDGLARSAEDRRRMPPHRLDSGIAERFWSLTRCYGWWGLAYLEAILRLADQQASAGEDAGVFDDARPVEPLEAGA